SAGRAARAPRARLRPALRHARRAPPPLPALRERRPRGKSSRGRIRARRRALPQPAGDLRLVVERESSPPPRAPPQPAAGVQAVDAPSRARKAAASIGRALAGRDRSKGRQIGGARSISATTPAEPARESPLSDA